MAIADIGEPITGSYQFPNGTAQLFTRGVAIVDHEGGRLRAGFSFPTLGRPRIVSLDPVTPLFEPFAVHFDPEGGDVDQLAHVIREALAARLALVPTGQNGGEVPLALGDVSSTGKPIRQFEIPLPELGDRTLYDVALLADAGGWRRVAPHAVYFKRTWDDFGLVHVTDIHVSRRNDRFKSLLEAADRHEAAERVYNHNNRFRGFVRYANYLHSIGELDVIVSTGDQYDYIYEDDDEPARGGNASFFRALILGQAPGPDFLDVEELRVPIFMTTGNHDYRRKAYRLIFDVHAAGQDLHTFRNYGSFNLDQDSARVLEARLHGLPVPVVPPFADANVSISEAAEMVAVDTDIAAHKQFLADKTSYVVALGRHRIVMIDSGPDIGVLTSALDALRQLMGETSEDESTFADGSPNSRGATDDDVLNVEKALSDSPTGGLVIVGIHAPLVNPRADYPYFLRETQRPFHPQQVSALLARLGSPLPSDRPIESRHPKWFPPANEDEPPTFVVRGDRNDLLDYAISRGGGDRLIELLAGGTTRSADLVLSGHTHYHNEFRARRLDTGELRFFMDYYTDTPANYYPSRFCTKGAASVPVSLQFEETYLEVHPGAPPDASPVRIGDAALEFNLHVPPYEDPLNASDDPLAWWENHRPVLLQTAALGPKKIIPFLNGFRVFRVGGGVIAKSHFVSVARLEAHRYQLPFAEAIAPDRPGPPRRPWRSVSSGGTLPGASITPVANGSDITVAVAGTSGEVYACAGSSRRGWGLWQPVSQGSTVPGGPVSAVSFGDKIALFLADVGGGVYTCFGSYHGGWGPWRSVSEGSTTPGGFIASVRTGDRIHVFLADPGGGIYVTVGQYDTGWAPWHSVSEGSSTPGAPLAAVLLAGNVTVVLADPSGGIYATAGTYQSGWGPWRSVSGGSTIPRGHVSAVVAGSRIKLFLADASGGVYMATGDYFSGWGPWSPVSEGSTTPGAPVAATVTEESVRLMLADPAGGVFSSLVAFDGSPGPWADISEGVTRPGGFVRSVTTDDGVTAFVADPAGGIFACLIGS